MSSSSRSSNSRSSIYKEETIALDADKAEAAAAPAVSAATTTAVVLDAHSNEDEKAEVSNCFSVFGSWDDTRPNPNTVASNSNEEETEILDFSYGDSDPHRGDPNTSFEGTSVQPQSPPQCRLFDKLKERDVVLNCREGNPAMFLFLESMLYAQCVLWYMQGRQNPSVSESKSFDHHRNNDDDDDLWLDGATRRVIQLLKQGKPYTLAGVRDVPRPILSGPGRILERDNVEGEDDNPDTTTTAGMMVRILSDEDAFTRIRQRLVEMKKTLSTDSFFVSGGSVSSESQPSVKEFARFMMPIDKEPPLLVADGAGSDSPCSIRVESVDAILLDVNTQVQKCESTLGDKNVSTGDSSDVNVKASCNNYSSGPDHALFTLAAQIVTMHTKCAETQVKAALAILEGFYESTFPAQPASLSIQRHPRFLLQSSLSSNNTAKDLFTCTVLSAESILEWAVTFVFEVYVEKYYDTTTTGNHPSSNSAQNDKNGVTKNAKTLTLTEGQSTVMPAETKSPTPTPYDVLFGRGGMTNGWVGNFRFRDLIALHRPDYMRAIKAEKVVVARRIVKAIRFGTPPGRFLKKSYYGDWYDVDDRTAAEKTAQGLRERAKVEKRQKSEMRRELRLHKKDNMEVGPKHHPTMNNYMMLSEVRKKPQMEAKSRPKTLGLSTQGVPPNAVDIHGNARVTDFDIILGRGGLSNNHIGNKRFRDIVALHRLDYNRAPKIQKPSVARVIVRAIRNGDPPGRFLQRCEKSGHWIDVGDKKAAEKTSQALREKASSSFSSSDSDVRSSNKGSTSNKVAESSGGLGMFAPDPFGFLAATTANVMGNILASGTYSGGQDTNKAVDREQLTTTIDSMAMNQEGAGNSTSDAKSPGTGVHV